MRNFRIPSNPLEHLDVVVDLASIREDQQLRLSNFQPGPAGVSSGLLADGVWVAVDYADPRRICFVNSDYSQITSDLSCLGRLFGGDSRLILSSEIERSIRHEDDRALLRVELGNERFRQRSAPTRQRRNNTEFGTFINLLLDISDASEPTLVRAVAAVDSFELLASSRQQQLLARNAVDTLIRFMTSAIMVDVQGSALLAELQGAEGQQLVELLQRAARIGAIQKSEYGERLRSSGRELRRMIREQDSPDSDVALFATFSRASTPISAPPSDDAIRPRRMSPPARMQSVIESITSDDIHAELPTWHGVPELTSPGRLRIRWEQNPGHLWLRVLDRNDLHLIAIAPVRQRASNLFECEAVLPPDRTLDSFSCELADEPSRSPRSTIEIIEDAVEAGQHASRLSARHQGREAESQWQLCAALWSEAGDTTRSNLALAYADGREQVSRLAFLHDAVRDLVSDD